MSFPTLLRFPLEINLFLLLVQTRQTPTSADGVLHQHVNSHTKGTNWA